MPTDLFSNQTSACVFDSFCGYGKLYSNSEFCLSFFVQKMRGEFVKSAPHGVDIFKRQSAVMRAISQKNKNPLGLRFNPKTRSGKAEMPETVF